MIINSLEKYKNVSLLISVIKNVYSIFYQISTIIIVLVL